MSKGRAYSSPDLLPSSSHSSTQDDTSLEGVAVNVKLLLKLIQDHNEASTKDEDSRKEQRVAGMISIIEDVKTRIKKSQRSGKAELRRCNTEIRRTQIPKEKKSEESQEPKQEENQKLRKELSASLTAQKSLQKMFSSLGKEKEIMAAELARKVQELNGMEEHINDLKVQNEMLSAKVKNYATENKEKKSGGEPKEALQERNKVLSDQLLKSLDGYRSLKRKLKETQEENIGIRKMMGEIEKEVAVGLERIHGFRQRRKNEDSMNFEEELSMVELMFQCFQAKVTISGPKRSECVKPKADILAEKAPVLA
ncbi:uncharacterized protein LOC143846589 [Tasmannia lanceolata]|uniref:uncharacterized protein LOC143846589 n=1 Tax=Tasmannia lanceolata TaxID=3420 RepID=UPI0040629921